MSKLLGISGDPLRRVGILQPRGTFNTDLVSLSGQYDQQNGTPSILVLANRQGLKFTYGSAVGDMNYLQDATAPNLFTYVQKPQVHIHFAPIDSTNVRYWLGLFSAGVSDGDNLAAMGVAGVGLRFSVPAGDTTWKLITCDGTNETVIDTGIPLGVDVPVDWFFDMLTSSSKIELYRDGSLLKTAIANLPGPTVPLCWMIREFTQEAASKSFWFGRVYWEAD